MSAPFNAPAFRGNNADKWGNGIDRNLNATDLDENLWHCICRLNRLEDILLPSSGATPQLVSIVSFTVTGSQLTVNMSDGSTQGPYTLPVAQWTRREDNDGQWAPDTIYLINDVFAASGFLYVTLLTHNSAAVNFDEDATDGNSNRLYLKIGATFSDSENNSEAAIEVTVDMANSYTRCVNAISAGGTAVHFSVAVVGAWAMDTEIRFRQCVDNSSIAFTFQDDSDGSIQVNWPLNATAYSQALGAVCLFKKVGEFELDASGDFAPNSAG